ncbi:MAG: hypothetical protein ACPG8N_00725 [Rhodothermales bacterium]|jgi:uncharacterized protein YoxC
MSLSWLLVLGSMLIAFGLPFLFYGMVKIMQNVTQTRSDLKDSASTMQRSLEAQSGSVQEVLTSQEKLIERIQHLEAIVTSEAWDTMAAEKQGRIADHVLQLEDQEVSDADRAARLARRVEKGQV